MYKYDRIVFVEFLEMVGRIAEFKFKGTELESIPLELKIEEILDELLTVLGAGFKRKPVNIEIDEGTESDSDY